MYLHHQAIRLSTGKEKNIVDRCRGVIRMWENVDKALERDGITFWKEAIQICRAKKSRTKTGESILKELKNKINSFQGCQLKFS